MNRENVLQIHNNRAYFTEYQVMENLSKAPNEFTLYARNKKYNMNININSVHYAPGYGCAKIR